MMMVPYIMGYTYVHNYKTFCVKEKKPQNSWGRLHALKKRNFKEHEMFWCMLYIVNNISDCQHAKQIWEFFFYKVLDFPSKFYKCVPCMNIQLQRGLKTFLLSRFVQLKSFMKNSQELSERILFEPCREGDDVLITFFLILHFHLLVMKAFFFFFSSFYLFIPF